MSSSHQVLVFATFTSTNLKPVKNDHGVLSDIMRATGVVDRDSRSYQRGNGMRVGTTVALPNRADFGSLGLVDEAEEVYRTESRLGFLG
jgi:hypothetical protein